MPGQAKHANNRKPRNPLQNAHFVLLSPDMAHVPPDEGFEVAFAGRSNAGKSSAINALTGQKSLARTSKTPGRTQALVFFALDDLRRLVDLPGYGYAKVSASVKKQWHQTLDSFLNQRQALRGIVLLMDIRHPLTEFDQQMIEWCHAQSMPLLLLLSKSDKLSKGAAHATLQQVNRTLTGYDKTTTQLFSMQDTPGIEQARLHIANWLEI
jgi:GTP-binding protein